LPSRKLAHGPLPGADALRYAIEIGAALQKVHSRGLLHGALSPSCIALSAGGARILEAAPAPDERAPYRAPELLCGDPPDVCSDVFAFGALIYEMASGRRAFAGAGAELTQNILTQDPAPLAAKSQVLAAMEAVIDGCLEKDRTRRRQRVQNAVIELKLAGRSASLAGGGKDGNILFAPGLSGGLYRVGASGGKPKLVLKLDESKSERADLWPQFLPGGKHSVFFQQTDLTPTSGIYVGSLEQPSYHRLFASQTNAVYAAASPDTPNSGYLLYINDRNLTARQFNTSTFEIAPYPVTLAHEIGAVRSLWRAPISVSSTGVLVYQDVGHPTRQVVWMDRGGRRLSVAGEAGNWGHRESRRMAAARLRQKLEPTARQPTCGCSMRAVPRNR
jgi:serine/threonine protein kinase